MSCVFWREGVAGRLGKVWRDEVGAEVSVFWGSVNWGEFAPIRKSRSKGDLQQIFFAEVFEWEEVVDFHHFGPESAGGDFGGEVAAFEADEAGGCGGVGSRGERGWVAGARVVLVLTEQGLGPGPEFF